MYKTDESGQESLQCFKCDIILSSVEDFYPHHVIHVEDPSVSLVQLSESVCTKILKTGSYSINSGVARKSTGSAVSPIKISFKKRGRKKIAFIASDKAAKNPADQRKNKKKVEGNKMLERFGASGVSIQRKGKATEAVKKEADAEQTDSSDAKPAPASNKELLEKFGGLISIVKKGSGKEEDMDDAKTSSGLSVASKSAKPFDFAEYAKQQQLKKELEEAKTPPRDPKALLASLSGIKGISFASKTPVKTETANQGDEKKDKKAPEAASKDKSESEEGSESEESESEDEKAAADTTEKKGPDPIRISNNLFAVKKEETDVDVKMNIDVKDVVLTGVDLLAKMTRKLSRDTPTPPSAATTPKPHSVPHTPDTTTVTDDDDIIMEAEVTKKPMVTGPSPTPSEQLHPDFMAPSEGPPAAMNGQVYQQHMAANQVNQPVVSSMDAQAMHNYAETQQVGNNVVQQANTVTYAQVDSTVTSMSGTTTVLEGTTYWTNVAGQAVAAPQDPLMSGDANISQTFLHSYLGDQTSHTLSSDGGEYMALERLADPNQQQQQQQFQDGAPMEQLTQQVQRLQPTPPHINVIPQHQMQMQPQAGKDSAAPHEVSQNIGPVEPVYDLMHGGMTIPQQQAAVGQPSTGQPFDPNLMQPPLPNLYPGYYQQQFNQMQSGQTGQTGQAAAGAAQGQFQMPPPMPPMLQARPQISPRPFQSMAAPRPRMGMKRPRMPGPRQSTPPKQPRMEGRGVSNTSPRLPGNSNITPPKKPGESKVANALASRGITMTSNRPQTGAVVRSPARVIPALNLGPGVSITPSSANRNRSVINHNVERPGPCATVDLTLDDDMPQRGGRFACNICPKIFTSNLALEAHKATHKSSPLPHKCEKCSAAYPSLTQLNQHRLTYHKLPARQLPDMVIPVVDINNAETRAKLQRLGVTQYVPLGQLESGNGGYFGLPILNIDSNHDKCTSTMQALGAGNVFHLGKLKQMPANR